MRAKKPKSDCSYMGDMPICIFFSIISPFPFLQSIFVICNSKNVTDIKPGLVISSNYINFSIVWFC